MPHILRANTENPQRKHNFPLLKLLRAMRVKEGAVNPPSAFRPGFAVPHMAETFSFGVFFSLSHNSPGSTHTHISTTPPGQGSTWAPPGTKLGHQSAKKKTPAEEPCSETVDMVPVNKQWHINITESKTGGKPLWACAGAQEGKNRLAPHARL